MEPSPPRPRRAVALLLACLGPGLGQLYLGRTRRGLVLLAVGLAFVPVAVVATLAVPSTAGLVAVLVSAAAALLALLVGLLDAAVPRATDGLAPPPGPRALLAAFVLLALASLVFGVGGAVWIRANLLQAFRIASGSMAPTLASGDQVLVEKRTRWDRPLERGDVVVYRAPGARGRAYVKRVVALAGEHVALWGDGVVVDGTPLAGDDEVERFPDGAEVHVHPGGRTVPPDAVLVPPGHVFVVGDARADSEDSRQHGPVPLADVIGVVRWRYWPPSRIGALRGSDEGR